MNIKRVPCLAVITNGWNRDRVVNVVSRDEISEIIFVGTWWHCESITPLPGMVGEMTLIGSVHDSCLRPIDDPGEPETLTTREPQEATC